MKLWRLTDPFDYKYARLSVQNSWKPKINQPICPECKSIDEERTQPLMIEWQPDSDVLGDFTWAGSQTVVVKSEVFEEIYSQYKGFVQGLVEMIQDPKLKKPQRISRRVKPRIWLPYEGPILYELWVTSWASADIQRSSIRVKKACNTCGKVLYELDNVEVQKSQWNPQKKNLDLVHHDRVTGKGLYVTKEALNGADFFRVHEFPLWILCLDYVKEFIEKKGYTNISFLEYGDVL